MDPLPRLGGRESRKNALRHVKPRRVRKPVVRELAIGPKLNRSEVPQLTEHLGGAGHRYPQHFPNVTDTQLSSLESHQNAQPIWVRKDPEGIGGLTEFCLRGKSRLGVRDYGRVDLVDLADSVPRLDGRSIGLSFTLHHFLKY